MPSVAVLPSLGPFGRVVDVRVIGHGFSVLGSNSGGGEGLVRPNLSSQTWYARPASAWTFGDGNILWAGTWTSHRVSFRGPMGRLFGSLETQDVLGNTVYAYKQWLALDGRKMTAPGRVIGGFIKDLGDNRPVEIADEPAFGGGLLALADPPVTPEAPGGTWKVVLTPSGWDVKRPDGQSVGVATPGVLFDGPLKFTVTDAPGLSIGDFYDVLVDDALQVYAITDFSTTDRVWRKGISRPTDPFRFVGEIARPSGEAAHAPWAVNDNGTLAAVVRGSRLVEIDLETLIRAETDISKPSIGFARTVDGGTETWAMITPTTGEALKGVEFFGQDRYEYWINYTAALSGSLTTTEGGSSGGGSTLMTVDFEVRKNGSLFKSLRIFDYSATVAMSVTYPAPPSYVGSQLVTTSRAIFWFHPLVPVSEWSYAEAVYTSTPGATQLVPGWLGGILCTFQNVYGCSHREQGEITVYSGGSVEVSGVGDHTGIYDFAYANDTGDSFLGCQGDSSRSPRWWPGLGYNLDTGELSGGGQTTLINPNGHFFFRYRDARSSSLFNFAVGHNGSSGNGLQTYDGWPFNFQTNPIQAPPGLPGIFSRSAADERGNYIHVTQAKAVVKADSCGYGSFYASQPQGSPAAGTDRDTGGLVPVVGSWVMRAGGPDMLSPSIVRDLAGVTFDNVWQVGVF